MGGDDKFRIRTLIFCVIIFVMLSAGHILALYVKGSAEIDDMKRQLEDESLNPVVRTEIEENLENATNIDFWDVLAGFGNILFGLDLPLPFAILISTVNGILLLTIGLLIWSFIKAHIPFISG